MKRFFDTAGKIVRRGYALIFAFIFVLYVGLAALPALLMADGRTSAAAIFYKGFHYLCHQYPWRSFFLKGEQPYYPLYQTGDSSIKTIEEAAERPIESISPREFLGTPQMGYKMAICQRDCAIYIAMALFCLVFCFSGNRIGTLPLALWLILGILPMAADGITQLLSYVLPWDLPVRESTPLLRTITGGMFGFFTCWYLFPQLEKSLQKGDACARS